MKKIYWIMIVTILLGLTEQVKADNFNYYLSTEGLNYAYVEKNNNQAINVQRGNIIYVTSMIENNTNTTNYELGKGKLTLRWDSTALSLVEVNGKYYNTSKSSFTNLTVGTINKTSNRLNIQEFSSNEIIKPGKNKLMEFKFQVLNTANIGVTSITQMDGEDSINCYHVKEAKEVKCAESLYSDLRFNIQKSNNNKLAWLKINNQELEFFNENTDEYDIEVEKDVENITITAGQKDNNAVIGGDLGTKKLEYGINKFTINVISESGIVNTYTINVTRIDERSTINTLQSLTLSSGDFVFNPNIVDYDITVLNSVDKITIESTLKDSKSRYAPGFGNRVVELNEGSNKILIKVISESNEERVYTLNVVRALSGNNTLKSLMINDEKITLNDDIFIYNYEVENNIESVTIKAVPSDNKATVNIKEKYELEVGDNEINIDITAADGSKASYIVNINRKKILSNNSKLSNIKIIGYTINFKPDVTLYNLRVKDEEEKLDIYTVPEDQLATIEIEGNKNLVDGTVIKVNVRAEDGTYTRYFINIEKSKKNTLLPVIIAIIVFLGLLALCIITLIRRKKKEEEKKKRLQEKINDDSKNLDSIGVEMDIEASDYEDVENNEILKEEANVNTNSNQELSNDLNENQIPIKKVLDSGESQNKDIV